MRQRGRTSLVVADDALGRGFAGLFAGTEIDLILTPDFKSAVWKKLCFNCAGAVSALLLQPAGVMHDESISEVARQLMRECIAVGRAEGAVLGDDLPEAVLEKYRRQPPDSLNSIHADRLFGRRMETDARNGAIVRIGRRHGIATPCNQMAVALLEALERTPAPR
jgi:2-dehydropantoate 2-reductase